MRPIHDRRSGSARSVGPMRSVKCYTVEFGVDETVQVLARDPVHAVRLSGKQDGRVVKTERWNFCPLDAIREFYEDGARWPDGAGLAGGSSEPSFPPLPPPNPPPTPSMYLMNYYSFEDITDDRCRVHLTSSVIPPQYIPGGKQGGKKGKFDGVTNTLHTVSTAGTGLELSGPRTFYIWVEWMDSDNDDHIMSAVDEYFFSHTNAGKNGFYVVIFDDTGTQYRNNSGRVAIGETDYLITMTFDDATGEFGIAVNDGPMTYETLGSGSAQLPGNKRVDFGSLAGGSAFFEGTIDEVSIWYGIQTDAHRNWMWNAGAGRTFEDIVGLLVGICPPSSPNTLAATALSYSSIGLTFAHSATDEEGFRIYRSPTGTGDWLWVGTLPANTYAFEDIGLTPVTPYYYKVVAYNDAGESFPTNVATATTLAAFPDAPTLLTATPTAWNQINTGWQDNSSNELSFRLERSPDGTSGWVTVGGAGALAPNSVAFSDIGLLGNTLYYYRVFAVNAAGDSLPSNVASATTPVQPPDYLTGLHIWGEFDRHMSGSAYTDPLDMPHKVNGGGTLGVDAYLQQHNWVGTHAANGQFSGAPSRGVAYATSTSSSEVNSGSFGLVLRSSNAVWYPYAGNTDTNWKFRDSPLARSFAPSSGNGAFDWVFFYSPYDVSMLTTTNTAARTLFSVGSYVSGAFRDGYGLFRSSNASGNFAQFNIRHSDGTTGSYVGTVPIPVNKRAMLQFRYDPANMRVGFSVNRSAWEWKTITTKIQATMSSGAWIGCQSTQNANGLATPMCGKLSNFIFYHGHITDSTADGLYNSGWGMYWHPTNGPTAYPLPTYNPYARVYSKGADQSTGRSDYFLSPGTVSGSAFSFIARIAHPRDMNAGGGYNYGQRLLLYPGSGGAAVTLRFDGSTFDFMVQGKIRRDMQTNSAYSLYHAATVNLQSSGSNHPNELHQSWINVAASWNGNTFAGGLYIWIPSLGWCRGDYGALWDTTGSVTLVNATSTFGGQNVANFSAESWATHVGFKNSYIDFSQATNRDKFFDPLSGFPKQLNETSWTEWGGQPQVWAPHGDLSRHKGSMAQWKNVGAFPSVAPIRASEPYMGGMWTAPSWTVAPPTSPTATAVGTNTINLTWVYATSGETGFIVEQSPNGTSSWAVLAMLAPGSQAYSHTGLFSATTNYYRISVTRDEGQSVPTSIVTATTGGTWAPWSIPGLVLWLDAANRGATTNRWDDRSGLGNHYTAASAPAFPTFSAGEAIFDGTTKIMSGPTTFQTLTAGELFMRVKNDLDPNPTLTATALASFSDTGSVHHYPHTDGNVYIGFGIGSRPNCTNPAQQLDVYHTLNTRSSGTYIVAINGTTIYSAAHAVSFSNFPKLGASGHDPSYKYAGRMKAVVLYNRILSASERTLVQDFLAAL